METICFSSPLLASSKLLTRMRTPYLHPLAPTQISPLRASQTSRLIQLRPYSNDHNNIKSTSAPASSSVSSLNQTELIKFSAIADTWWDADGPFRPLHVMNPTRLAFIRSTLCRHFGKDPNIARPFEGLKFVDVGCGGGILSEPLRMGATVTGVDAVDKNITIARLHADLDPVTASIEYRCTTAEKLVEEQREFDAVLALEPLARMGATVTGVDAVDKNITIARLHADLDPVTASIEYRCTTAEKLVEEQREFDAVLALEVIEHVADPTEFCKSLSALTVTQGATVISTINRSMRAYATAIVAAEYLLQWLPKGTHDWSSFLTPEELVLILQRSSVSIQEMADFAYNPLSGRWSLSDDIGVNFIAYGTKTNG